MCDNVEMSVLHFKHFGKNGIKGKKIKKSSLFSLKKLRLDSGSFDQR